MAAYIEHIQALAQRINQSESLPLRWNQYDDSEGLYYFLASKMHGAGLLDVERSDTAITVHGLTAKGQKLIDTSDRLSADFLNRIHQALYDDSPPNGMNPRPDSA